MLRFVLFAAFVASVATALRLEDVEEGSCRGARIKSVPLGDDISYLDNLKYIPAGSRHNMYGIASSHPRFAEMREQELVDNICLIHNGTVASGLGSAFGFGGRVLGTYGFAPRRGQQSTYDLYVYPPSGDGAPFAIGTQTVTLTDNKSFIFIVNCVTAHSEQKSWEVLSATPTLSAATRRVIRNHAASIGFDSDHFLFLNYDNCGDISHQHGGDSLDDRRGQRHWGGNGLKGRAGPFGRRGGSSQLGWNN